MTTDYNEFVCVLEDMGYGQLWRMPGPPIGKPNWLEMWCNGEVGIILQSFESGGVGLFHTHNVPKNMADCARWIDSLTIQDAGD